MGAVSLAPQDFAAYAARASRVCPIDGFAKMPLRASIFAHGITGAVSLAPQDFAAYAARASRVCPIDGFAKCPCKQAFLLMV